MSERVSSPASTSCGGPKAWLSCPGQEKEEAGKCGDGLGGINRRVAKKMKTRERYGGRKEKMRKEKGKEEREEEEEDTEEEYEGKEEKV